MSAGQCSNDDKNFQFSEESSSDHGLDDFSDEENEIMAESTNNYIDEFTRDKNAIMNWFIRSGITRNAGNMLLDILRNVNPNSLKQLPRDIRTILSTRHDTKVKSLVNGSYVYFGISKMLNHENVALFDSNSKTIELSINIDGLPLCKGSKVQFWPILGSVEDYDVFLIAIFQGRRKPDNVNEFMKEFVDEAKQLTENGIFIKGKEYKFRLKAVLADAPAKSYILKIKGHSGRSSCTKCTVTGSYVNKRICFSQTDAPARSNEDFIAQKDRNYHHFSEKECELLRIPNFDIVKQVPLDYMHLICMGVVKKLLLGWCEEPLREKVRILSASTVKIVSERLKYLADFTPIEFQRRPRSLDDLHMWKSTEFRQFLLYTGPVVLHKLLPVGNEFHFILFHFCARSLSDSSNITRSNIAEIEKLMISFVKQCQSLYGEHFISHNIHGLIHLANDALHLGNLDAFSCFKFENFLFKLKRLVKSGNAPLQQVINRYYELLQIQQFSINQDNFTIDQAILTHPCSQASVTDPEFEEFQQMQFKLIRLRADKESDAYCALSGDKFIRVTKFMRHTKTGETYIVGKRFRKSYPFYSYPKSSTIVGIYCIEKLSSSISAYNLSMFEAKCYYMPVKDSRIAVVSKLLH